MERKPPRRHEPEDNAIYAIHYRGKLLSPNVWERYSHHWGGNSLYGWRPPKKLYYKLGHARNGIRHLPKEIQMEAEIVKYVPEQKTS